MVHLRRHIGEKNHHCTLCDRRFVKYSELRAHSENVHAGQVGLKPLQQQVQRRQVVSPKVEPVSHETESNGRFGQGPGRARVPGRTATVTMVPRAVSNTTQTQAQSSGFTGAPMAQRAIAFSPTTHWTRFTKTIRSPIHKSPTPPAQQSKPTEAQLKMCKTLLAVERAFDIANNANTPSPTVDVTTAASKDLPEQATNVTTGTTQFTVTVTTDVTGSTSWVAGPVTQVEAAPSTAASALAPSLNRQHISASTNFSSPTELSNDLFPPLPPDYSAMKSLDTTAQSEHVDNYSFVHAALSNDDALTSPAVVTIDDMLEHITAAEGSAYKDHAGAGHLLNPRERELSGTTGIDKNIPRSTHEMMRGSHTNDRVVQPHGGEYVSPIVGHADNLDDLVFDGDAVQLNLPPGDDDHRYTIYEGDGTRKSLKRKRYDSDAREDSFSGGLKTLPYSCDDDQVDVTEFLRELFDKDDERKVVCTS